MILSTALALTLSASPANAPGLQWHQGTLDSALDKAAAHEVPAVVYFWRDGSEYCAKFFQETLADERIVKALGHSVLVSAQHGTDDGGALFERYGVQSLPSLAFLAPDGSIDDMVAGYAEADTLVYELERILKGELTMTDLRNKLATAEEGSDEYFEWRFRMAQKLGDFGDAEAKLAGMEAIAKDDRRGETLHGARAHLALAEKEILGDEEGYYEDGEKPDYDTKSLKKLARKIKHPEGQFEAWNTCGLFDARSGDVASACRAWSEAAEVVPEERAMSWAGNTAAWIMEIEGERTSKEKELALTLAMRAAELASAEEPCGCEADCSCAPPSKTHAAYLALLARTYRFCGDAELARATAQKAVELDPSDERREQVGELL